MDPFTIHRPSGQTLLLYDSPHSGRYYPPIFELGAPLSQVRRGEDAYVDELLLPSVDAGALLLINNYPRCYVDVNRAVDDIDPDQLSEPWPGALLPTDKSKRGLGLIRRTVVPGVEAQARKLTVAEVQARISSIYVPYHAELDQLVAELHARNGVVWHIDWHSMKSVGNAMTPDGPGAMRPDFVVSDGNGTTAASHVTESAVRLLSELGYKVSVNVPYTGGTIVKRVGQPGRGIHSLQIEINRALYLNEESVEKKPEAVKLAEALRKFTKSIGASVMRELSR
jgi:N-formylglutamate deformylase